MAPLSVGSRRLPRTSRRAAVLSAVVSPVQNRCDGQNIALSHFRSRPLAPKAFGANNRTGVLRSVQIAPRGCGLAVSLKEQTEHQKILERNKDLLLGTICWCALYFCSCICSIISPVATLSTSSAVVAGVAASATDAKAQRKEGLNQEKNPRENV
jgi:hypothetical protein